MLHFPYLLILFLGVSLFYPASAFSAHPTFQEWLELYGAWDRLEKEYAQEPSAETPEAILKRAEVYLNLNSPQKALEVLEMTPAFSEPTLEAERLWLGGKALRAMGNLTRCVLWFAQASKFINDDSVIRRRFKKEPSLEAIWHDVWLKMYWSYTANHTLSRKTQKEALDMVMGIGRTVWSNDFWLQANSLINPHPLSAVVPPAPQTAGTPEAAPVVPMMTETDTRLIAQAMALVSLEKFDDALDRVSQLGQEPARMFWGYVIQFLNDGFSPSELEVFVQENQLKAHVFWAGNVLAPYSKSRSDWFLGNPDSGPWTQFRNNLLEMPFAEAKRAIDNELGSMLISEQTASLLNDFKFALSLSNGEFGTAATIWDSVNKRSLPLSLRLSGAFFFKDNLNKILPEKAVDSYKLYPILAALFGAAGIDINKGIDAPFWTAAPKDQLPPLSQAHYPLDRLLLLAHWQAQFAQEPTVELAKRSAYLFDDSSFGIQSLIYLADNAVQAKKLQLGAFYLNRIDETALPSDLRMAWLDIKTRLELDSGRQSSALKTYKEMVATGEPIPVMTRLRMALLFQQRKEFKSAQAELLAMWDQRAEMTTTLQAETLFWLGEGEHAMRNTGKALDYYLQLAWKYPQENIWALTAMYRASLIYEKRGKYNTAKRLLKTVVKNASRKEQREAAKARINAIEKKMGKQKKSVKSTLVYPF